jgi:PAS domain S-box-containing protein
MAISEEQLYESVLHAPIGVCILDARTLVAELVNDKFLEITGKPREAVLGRWYWDPFGDVRSYYEETLNEVIRSGEAYHAEEVRMKLVRPDQEPVFISFVYSPLKNARGEVIKVTVWILENTQQVRKRERVELSEKHFRRLADLVPAKILSALPNGEFTYFNKQWLDFCGLSREDTHDFDYREVIHPEEIGEFQRRLELAARSTEPLVMEMRFKNKQGDYIWHLNIASPVADDHGEIKMWVGSATEIQHLKDEDQRKSDFISMLSHELKTPVTSIKGYVQVLTRIIEKKPEELSAETLLPSLYRVNKLVSLLATLIRDMLDLTRIESGRLELQKTEFSMNELVDAVLADFQFTDTSHEIRVEHEGLCLVRADRNKIAQVFINLVSNAIKYSPGATQVDVKVFQTEDGLATVSVRDYGIGLDQQQQSRVFERFYRVEGYSGEMFTGFGIGLFIASSIIGKHHGKISVESKIGEGSVFLFALPAEA